MKRSLSRKEFIQLSALASLALPVMGLTGCSSKKELNNTDGSKRYGSDLGLQVYGIRELLAQNPQGVFKSVADIGIKNIEVFDPSSLKTYVPIIKDNGMTALATHFLSGYITGQWETLKKMGMTPPENYRFENIVDDCATHGVNYLGIAILMPEERQSLDDFKRFADLANQHAEISKKAGVQLYYHNHSYEFKPTDGTTPMEVLLKGFDPSLIKIELDVFWAAIARANPVEWIKKLGNQLLFLHLKDLKAGTPTDYSVFDVDKGAFLEIGSGSLDFVSIFKAAKEAGATHAFLDQDHTVLDKFESIKKSYDYINSQAL